MAWRNSNQRRQYAGQGKMIKPPSKYWETETQDNHSVVYSLKEQLW
jgi:hypothetical protein